MRGSLRMLSVAVLVAAPMVVGVAAPAGARSAAPKFKVSQAAAPAAAPNSNVSGAGATLKYKPKSLSAVLYTQTQCNDPLTNTSFSITNTTTKKVIITIDGQKIFALAGHRILDLCVYGQSGVLTLGLKGSTHTLKVSLS